MRKTETYETSLFLTCLFLSFSCLFLDKIGALRPIRGILEIVSLPVEYSLTSFGEKVKKELGFFARFRKIYRENQKLQKQLSLLEAEVVRLNEVERENTLLRAQFEEVITQDLDLIPALVTGFNRLLHLGVGAHEGVKKGMPVVFKNILVGKVVQVTPHACSVILATDPEFKIAVKVQREGHTARGLLSGRFQNTMLLSRVLPEEKIAEGDFVVTRGEEKIPPGLAIGKIAKIEKSRAALFQEAEVVPLFRYQDLEMVFVVKVP